MEARNIDMEKCLFSPKTSYGSQILQFFQILHIVALIRNVRTVLIAVADTIATHNRV